jgi:hypothetical protein
MKTRHKKVNRESERQSERNSLFDELDWMVVATASSNRNNSNSNNSNYRRHAPPGPDTAV